MNIRMVSYVVGKILLAEAVLMAIPMAIAIIYKEDSVFAFAVTIIIITLLGLLTGVKQPKHHTLYARDGLVIVAFAWILISLLGALPMYISGTIPNYVDSFFETVSGFTTTGASILTHIEGINRSLLFWRSFTHWFGGMGVLVFVMAVIPMSGGQAMHLMRAEVPGPSVGKLVSRVKDSAIILYAIYFALTVIEIILLKCFGMSWFDSCIHAFGSAGTGGFSSKNLSVGAFESPIIENTIGIFMLLFGINFNLYYFILIGKIKEVLKSEELRTYLAVIAVSTTAIALNINSIYQSLPDSFRLSFFQVSSIITTTGFATTDFNMWPTFSKVILVILMFFGACAGSTGGGLKIARVVMLAKTAFYDMRKMIFPKSVTTVKFEGKTLEEKDIRGVSLYLTVYLMILMGSVMVISLDKFDTATTFTSVIACLNNIGPGLELVGPMGNYSQFSILSKLVLSFDMLVGRLEIFPMLLIFAPSVWRSNKLKRILVSKEEF